MDNVKEVKEKAEKAEIEKQAEDKKSQLWVQRRSIPLSNPVEPLKGTNGSKPLSPGHK